MLDLIEKSENWTVITIDDKLMKKGVSKFKQMNDKDWSLVDCISMIISKDFDIANIFTNDHHFEQAGFKILLHKDYPMGARDLTTLLAQVKEKNPEAVIALCYPAGAFTITAQAKEVGFIGTLIGVMLMFAALGVSLQQGDSGSIRGAIGGFSQAVISSLIGYIISVTCKWLHFIETRKEVEHA